MKFLVLIELPFENNEEEADDDEVESGDLYKGENYLS